MTEHFISVVLPVHNQADHIAGIVKEFEEALAGVQYPHELILVINACRDRSLQVCQDLAQQYSPIRVLHSDRGGWGLAVNLGLNAAQGDVLCYTNSARTSAQDLTLLLLYGLVYPGTVVKANRKIRDSWFRRLGSLLYNLECRALFDLSNWDVNGTPKVFPRSCHKLLDLTLNDDLMDVEFNIVCRQEGYPMLEVPIFSSKRHGGNSTTNLRSALKMYWGAYRISQTASKNGK